MGSQRIRSLVSAIHWNQPQGYRAGWQVDLKGKMENIQPSNYSTWKQKSIEITFSKSWIGHQSLLKMPFIIITGRDQIHRPTLVGELQSREPTSNIYLLMESSWGLTLISVLTVPIAHSEFNSVSLLKVWVKLKTLEKHDLDKFRNAPWTKKIQRRYYNLSWSPIGAAPRPGYGVDVYTCASAVQIPPWFPYLGSSEPSSPTLSVVHPWKTGSFIAVG